MATRSVPIKQELGKGYTRSGMRYQGESWALDKGEYEDLINIQAGISEQELEFEQKRDNLKDYNRFVDGSQFKTLNELKFGGRVQYDEVSSLGDLMLYIHEKLYIMTMQEAFGVTHRLRDNITWKRNGNETLNNGVPILDVGDQLVVFPKDVAYAKYQEFGYRHVPGKYIYRRVANMAKARFGRAFIIEHKVLQAQEIPPQRVRAFRTRNGRTFSYSKFSQDYYKKRWAVSYPAIKITQRQGVKFYV